MTAHTTAQAYEVDGLTPTDRFVLVTLADGAGDAFDLGYAGSLSARRTRLGREAVQKAIEQFLQRRLIVPFEDGSGLYRLNLDE